MSAAIELAPLIGIALACVVLGVSRATFYRAQQGPAVVATPSTRVPSPLALSEPERRQIREALHAPQYADSSARTVFARLLDAGCYLASVSSFYRILRADGEARPRRNQLSHPLYTKPELLATKPRELWSWDITKLKGPGKWEHFHLYVILDVFSRYVVGWMLAAQECAELAKALIAGSCDNEAIAPHQLTLHADRGSSMRSKPVAQLLVDLGVTKSHSRPHVSDDNPFSESQFKTLKYRPGFPDRFACIEQARAFCQQFFAWYNHEHRHSGIGYMTPAAMHTGQAIQLYEARQRVLEHAFAKDPRRFKGRMPRPPDLPTQVGINLPKTMPPTAQPPSQICSVN
jgi:putative transposase